MLTRKMGRSELRETVALRFPGPHFPRFSVATDNFRDLCELIYIEIHLTVLDFRYFQTGWEFKYFLPTLAHIESISSALDFLYILA